MNRTIYLDNNATTKVSEEVLTAMLPYLTNEFGNPSSIYSIGKKVKTKIEEARMIIAKHINASANEIIFTGSASESNATAIFSAVKNNPTKKHIITTKVEHSSILEAMKYLESIGYIITYLSVDTKGRLNLEELKKNITNDTLLVTVMLANNEIGNIYPIKEIAEIIKNRDILFHVDAVQAMSKMKIDVKDLGIDSLSIAGHKIHAPKGIGALYVKEGIKVAPLIFGHQEKDKRGGTENVPYIVGLSKAVELIDLNDTVRIKALRDYLESEIKTNINDIVIYGDIENRLVNTTNIAFKGVKGEELLLMLEVNNIFVSTGSACNSFDINPSHVLTAMQVDFSNSSPIRISLSSDNTKEEIDMFIKVLINVVNTLRKRIEK